MASFDENGKYIKTNWKAGDKITATKLNKIEESIEAVNDNDISRHVEADARLDALEAKDVAHDKEFTNVKNTIANNKAAAELGDYEINSRMTFLENELNEGIEEVHNVASTVDGKINQAVTNVNNVASTVDGKIAAAEANMTTQVNQGKADMEAMVAEVEAELEYIENYKINKEHIIVNDINELNTLIEKAYEEKRNLYIPKQATPYILNETISLKDGVNIYSNYAVIETSGYFDVCKCEGVSNISINNLIIDGGENVNTSSFYNGFYIENSNNITIKDCEIRNIIGYDCNDGAINVRGDSMNIIVDNCYIHDCSGGGVVLLGEQVKNNKIINSKLINIAKSPIMIKTGSNNNYVGYNLIQDGGESNISVNGKYNIIEGNIIHESLLLGINLGHDDDLEVSDYSIINNNVLYNSGIGGNRCNNVEIRNNKVYNPPTKGISLMTCNCCTIIDNLIYGGCKDGGINILCDSTSVNNNCIISRNKIINANREGIRIYNTRYSNISDNIIETPCYIGVPSYEVYCGGIIVEGDNPTPSQNNIIKNNIISDNREDKILKYGVNSTSGRNNLNLVDGNIIYGCEIGINARGSNGTNYIDGVSTPITNS